ncbi:MAG: hypothetical protein II836_00975 [Clostridia bacterium]|nr:hypothetical protein [Clostridia bacterium]
MTRHRRARIAAAVWTVAFAAVLGGAAAVRAERAQTVRAARTAGLLAETDAAVYRLAEDAGDGMLAYHRAMTASECAARAGETPAAEAFAELGEIIRQRGIDRAPVRETVEAYFRGTLPDPAREDAGRSDVLPESVLPPGAANKAEAAAKRIVGERAVLSRGTVRPGEKLLFTASNAYVLVDARTGEPVEFSLSLAPGEDRLDARSCADAARQFLRESCPSADTEEADARVTFPEPGFAWVRLPGASVRVRRDTGKVVGLVRA